MCEIVARKRIEFLFFAAFVLSFIAFRIYVLLVGGIDIIFEAIGAICCLTFLLGLCVYRMHRPNNPNIRNHQIIESTDPRFRRIPGLYRFSTRFQYSTDFYVDDVHELRRLIASFPRFAFHAKDWQGTIASSSMLDDEITHTKLQNKLQSSHQARSQHVNRVFVQAQELELSEHLTCRSSSCSGGEKEPQDLQCAIEEGRKLQDSTTCAICLANYAEDDTLMLLPCCHHFHESCVISWMDRKAECPLCKLDMRRIITSIQEQSEPSSDQVQSKPDVVVSNSKRSTMIDEEGNVPILQPSPSVLSVASKHSLGSVYIDENKNDDIESQRSIRSNVNDDTSQQSSSQEKRSQISYHYVESSGQGRTLLAISV